MKKMPLVSINIRTYNSAKTLQETLESIKKQTYPNIEVLIADGYSSDETVNIAKTFKTTIHFASKLGEARQKNYEKSRGIYIFSIDSDQILDKDLVGRCVAMCERGYDALTISERSIIRKGTYLEKLIAYDKWLIDKTRSIDPVFGAACPRFFRKSILSSTQWLNVLSIFDDAILYAKLLEQKAKVGYIHEPGIGHYEITRWSQLWKKFFRYGRGYIMAFRELPLTVSTHSLPRKSYFSTSALSKPHYFFGLFLLYSVKAVAASSGMIFSVIESSRSTLLRMLSRLWYEAMERNENNIFFLLEKNSKAKVLDVGCGDGKVTMKYQSAMRCRNISGIDGQKGRVMAAKMRGVHAVVADIEKKWPFPDNSFDVVISNQVIEHMLDIDHFISETYRVLRKGGYSVVSTENLASWHSIGALILGFQDFSHHILKVKHVGNPCSLHFGEKTATWSKKDHSGVDDSAYPHIKIMTYKSLIQVYEAYNFSFEDGRGSGYYPLFSFFSSFMSHVDPYHCHFICIKVRKE